MVLNGLDHLADAAPWLKGRWKYCKPAAARPDHLDIRRNSDADIRH